MKLVITENLWVLLVAIAAAIAGYYFDRPFFYYGSMICIVAFVVSIAKFWMKGLEDDE